MDIKTTGNKILIALEKDTREPEETKSGILLSKPSEPSSTINATVIGIGKDVLEVQVGDIVVCEKMTMHSFRMDGEDYQIVPEPSILGYKSSKENLQPINEGDTNE